MSPRREQDIIPPAGAWRAPLAAFYAAGAVSEAPLWIVSPVDGPKQILDRTFRRAGRVEGAFGSDLAVLETACGRGRQALLTRAGGRDEPDSVEALEWTGQQLAPAGDPLAFPGP